MSYLVDKFWSLTRIEKKIFCEAAVLLLLCQLMIKTIPFRHIYRRLGARIAILRTGWVSLMILGL